MYQIETKRDNRVSYNSFFLWLSLVTKHHNPSTFPRSSNLGRTCWKEKKLLRFPEWKNVILTRCPVLLCLDSHLQSLSYSCVCLTAITVTIHTPKTTQFCVAYLIQLGTVEFNSFSSFNTCDIGSNLFNHLNARIALNFCQISNSRKQVPQGNNDASRLIDWLIDWLIEEIEEIEWLIDWYADFFLLLIQF